MTTGHMCSTGPTATFRKLYDIGYAAGEQFYDEHAEALRAAALDSGAEAVA